MSKLSKMDKAAILAHERGYRILKSGKVKSPSGNVRSCYVKATSKSKYPLCAFNVRFGEEVFPVPFAKLLVYQKYGMKAFAKGQVIRHLNDRSMDNRWGNVVIGTRHQNAMDTPKRERVARAKKAAKASVKARQNEKRQPMASNRKGVVCKYTMAKSKNGRAHKWHSRKEAHAAAHAHAKSSGSTTYVFRRCTKTTKRAAVRIGECTARGCKWY